MYFYYDVRKDIPHPLKQGLSIFCSTFECIVINIKQQFFRYTHMMNQEDIFKKIGQILSELNDQYQYLAQNPQELNELELELFLANSSFLSDHVQIIKKLNSKAIQKSLPEHTITAQQEAPSQTFILPAESSAEAAAEVVIERVLPVQEIDDAAEATIVQEPSTLKPVIEEEIFKPDNTPSPFEFILNEKPSADDRFEFEEKSVDEIFDRPLSKEEELIIAQKQKLREKDSLELQLPEEDEIGPEPFLVSESSPAEEQVLVQHPVDDTELQLDIEAGAVEITEPETEEDPEPVQTSFVEGSEVEEPATAIAEPAVLPRPVEAYIPPLAETLTPENTPKPTLNDMLSGNAGLRYGAEKSKVEIKDLKQAISLNDKMRYIKDLFNGYNLAYAEAIDLLNKMPDFKTADAFLKNNYSVKNNWAEKQETADQFYELLNQRFPVK